MSSARFRQLAGWLALGVSATLVEIALVTLLHQPLALPLWLATALAAETMILARFFANDRLVFAHRRPTWRRLGKYHSACAGSFVVSWVVINTAASLFGVQFQLATVIGSGASFVWSLLTNFLWVWAQPAVHAAPPRLPHTAAGELQEVPVPVPVER